jgi:DNA repair protein RadD
MELRAYQIAAVNQVKDIFETGVKRVLLTLPTGAGKTVIAADIIKKAVAKGHQVLFLTHRKELLEQTHAVLKKLGINASIIMRKDPREWAGAQVHVATVQTLRLRKRVLPKADLLIVDEAHLSIAKSWVSLIEAYKDAWVIGLTATPIRLDGRALNHIYQELVTVASIDYLINHSYLVPAKLYTPTIPNLKGIPKSMGDFTSLQSHLAMRKIMGSLIDSYKKITPGKKAICFCCTIDHAKEVAAEFNKAGIPADYICSDSNNREQVIKKLIKGEINVLTNVNILSEGWDAPEIEVAILARPTYSVALHFQQIGRILRPYPGKDFSVILDHAGNSFRHGTITDVQDWSLKGLTYKSDKEMYYLTICKNCFAAYRGIKCKECGHKSDFKKPLPFYQKEIQLEEAKNIPSLIDEIRREYFILKAKATKMKYKPWWPRWVLTKKFGKGMVDNFYNTHLR